MGTHHKIALILHVSTIPLIISLILIMTISAFTRVFRKRTAMIVLIIVSWLILFMLIASSILRVEKFEGPCLVPTRIAFSYHKNVYIVFTVASLILSLIVTQILAFAGYLRSKITVLSIDGDIHHCDRPVAEKLAGSSSMVTVRTLDAF
uniref:Uncharacterized protein n=1 Tax=Caenorhabditis japonica TaxID=281687 RepID=A0A8R1DN55_CAEJA